MSTIKFVLVRGDKEIGPFEMPFEEMDYYNMSPQDIEEQLEDEMWDWVCNKHEIKIVKEQTIREKDDDLAALRREAAITKEALERHIRSSNEVMEEMNTPDKVFIKWVDHFGEVEEYNSKEAARERLEELFKDRDENPDNLEVYFAKREQLSVNYQPEVEFDSD